MSLLKKMGAKIIDLAAEVDQLTHERDAALEALKPFAEKAIFWQRDTRPDDQLVMFHETLSLGTLRRAAMVGKK